MCACGGGGGGGVDVLNTVFCEVQALTLFISIPFLTEEVTLSLHPVRRKGYPFHIPTVESLETVHLFFIGTLFVRVIQRPFYLNDSQFPTFSIVTPAREISSLQPEKGTPFE